MTQNLFLIPASFRCWRCYRGLRTRTSSGNGRCLTACSATFSRSTVSSLSTQTKSCTSLPACSGASSKRAWLHTWPLVLHCDMSWKPYANPTALKCITLALLHWIGLRIGKRSCIPPPPFLMLYNLPQHYQVPDQRFILTHLF